MSIRENKILVRRYFEDAPKNPDVCNEIFSPVFKFHTIQHASITAQVVESSPQSEKAAYEWLRSVWSPDWHMSVDEIMAENDRVMVRWTFYGIQQGEYSGLPPTKKPVTYSGINIFRIDEGKIAEIWDISDRLWLWQQLGVLPDIQEAIRVKKAAWLAQPSDKKDVDS
jgi:predicted ester cyclase